MFKKIGFLFTLCLIGSNAHATIITSAHVTWTPGMPGSYSIGGGDQDGAFFSVGTRNGAGDINLDLSYFTTAPRCSVTATNGSQMISTINGTPSTTLVRVTMFSSGSGTDSSFDIICIGN